MERESRHASDHKEAIGIFDSGIGGLTVLREISIALPHEDLIYLGDTARVPYGTKSRKTVLGYAIRNIEFLLAKGVKAVVVACNTASAFGLTHLKERFHLPLIGVIEPGAKRAASHSKTKIIGIIGTEGTIDSGAYQETLSSIDPRIKTVVQSCPLLVALAEEGWCEGPAVDLILDRYLRLFKSSGMDKSGRDVVDTLILGCTHYPLFHRAVNRYLGRQVTLVDSALATSEELKGVLTKEGLLCPDKREGSVAYYATDSPQRMKRIGPLFLGREIDEVTQVEI